MTKSKVQKSSHWHNNINKYNLSILLLCFQVIFFLLQATSTAELPEDCTTYCLPDCVSSLPLGREHRASSGADQVVIGATCGDMTVVQRAGDYSYTWSIDRVSNAGQSAPPQRLMLTASPHAGDAIEIDNAMR